MVTNRMQRRGSERDIERRIRQFDEIVRLGLALRADMGLPSVLSQLVESINGTLGFGTAVLCLLHDQSEYVEIAASAGISEAQHRNLVAMPPRTERLLAALHPDHLRSRSYFISHHNRAVFQGIEGLVAVPAVPTPMHNTPDAWHPGDLLLVPLVHPRAEQLLGILALGHPEDGQIPTRESIEVVELFANHAALAIDTARLFQEREYERQVLENGLMEVLFRMEEVQQGNLAVQVDLHGTALRPLAASLNGVVQTLSGLLREVHLASEGVSTNASEMRVSAGQLASGAQHQAEQILEVSRAVEGMAHSVQRIADTASTSSAVAHAAIAVSNTGRIAAERAAEGMNGMRDLTLQISKKMKRLGERIQEIGEIAQLVSDFANQTNLLALNAAIEAARAGDHGRGFAIVAHEIRNLANSSGEATKEIYARLRGIQNDTNQVAVTIEHSTEQVVVQSDLAAQAGAALQEVDAVTQQIATAIAAMNEIATEQAASALATSQAITEIAAISAQTRDGMVAMDAGMERLVELSASLRRKISVFRLSGMAAPQPLLSGATIPAHEQATEPMPAIDPLFAHLAHPEDAFPPQPAPGQSLARAKTTTVLPRVPAPMHPPLPTLEPIPPADFAASPVERGRATSKLDVLLPPAHEEPPA